MYGKRLKKTAPMVNSAEVLVCSTLMMLPLAVISDTPWSISPSSGAIAAVFGIAVISTTMAYLLYFRILATAGATNVLLVTFLIPISALLLGVGLLGEAIKVLEIDGMGCFFLGLMVIDGRAPIWISKRRIIWQPR